jgi:chorismate mutase
MTESEDIIQRRREKILSRATSEQNEEDLDATSTASGKSNVFDRYKLLKEKEENEVLPLLSR